MFWKKYVNLHRQINYVQDEVLQIVMDVGCHPILHPLV